MQGIEREYFGKLNVESIKYNFSFASSLSLFLFLQFPGLESFLLSCAMPLMIHKFLEPWCRCTIVPIYPGLLTFSFLLFHVFFYLQITFFYFLEFYTKKFQERSNSGWVFLLLLLLLFYFFSHFLFLL